MAKDKFQKALKRVRNASKKGELSDILKVCFENGIISSEDLLKMRDIFVSEGVKVMIDAPVMGRIIYSTEEIVQNRLDDVAEVKKDGPFVNMKGTLHKIEGADGKSFWYSDQKRYLANTGLTHTNNFRKLFGKSYYWDKDLCTKELIKVVKKSFLETFKDSEGNRIPVEMEVYRAMVDTIADKVFNGKAITVTNGTLDQRGRVYWIYDSLMFNINTSKYARACCVLPSEGHRHLSPEGTKWLFWSAATLGSKKEFVNWKAREDYGRKLLEEYSSKTVKEVIRDPEELFLYHLAQMYKNNSQPFPGFIEFDMSCSVLSLIAILSHNVPAMKLLGLIDVDPSQSVIDQWTRLSILGFNMAKGKEWETKSPMPRAVVKVLTTVAYGLSEKNLEEVLFHDFPKGSFKLDKGEKYETVIRCWVDQLKELMNEPRLKGLFTWATLFRNAIKRDKHQLKWLGNTVTTAYLKPMENTKEDKEASLVFDKTRGFAYDGELHVQTDEFLDQKIADAKAKAAARNREYKGTRESLYRRVQLGRKVKYDQQYLYWASWIIHSLDSLLAALIAKRMGDNPEYIMSNHDAFFLHPNAIPTFLTETHLFFHWLWEKGQNNVLEFAEGLGNDVFDKVKAYFRTYEDMEEPNWTSSNFFK